MSQASITSRAIEIIRQDNVGIQLNWTGTPTGTFDFQVSVDHKEDSNGVVMEEGNWVSIPLTTPITAAGSPDSAYVDFNQLSAAYMRVVYTKTSGSGTLDGFIAAKGV